MNCKKTIAGISALSMLLSTSAVSAVNAFAADDETTNYTDKTINAYLYSKDNVDTMTVRYYDDKPNIPYVKFSEFYNKWLGQDVEITNNNDGTYVVKVPVGAEATFNVEDDTLKVGDGRFFVPEEDATGSSGISDIFIRELADDSESGDGEESEELVMDFGKYHIDFYGDDSDIWCPAPTLCENFAGAMKQSLYLDGSIYFCSYMTADFSRLMLPQSGEHINYLLETYKDGRPQDLIDYNYNSLCMGMDYSYGYPGRMPFNELMAEKGFDGMLEEANDGTRKIKELLHSEDFDEYSAGLELLNKYFYDGGHTSFVAIPYFFDKKFNVFDGETAKVVNDIIANSGEFEQSFDLDAERNSEIESNKGVEAARNKMIESADRVEKLSLSTYFSKGEVAVLQFDTFEIKPDEWDAYYHEGTELPADVISDFYTAVKMADSDPAVKKLVFDIASNGGGHMATAMYMFDLINDIDSVTVKLSSSLTDSILVEDKFVTDKNLDKVIDEKDDEVKFDLQYGVITSKLSFSCGNWFPSLCRDNNILIMGERSGGGSCSVQVAILPDGMMYSYSTGMTFVDSNGESIDLGIKPDYENVKFAEDGSKDFSEVYNFDNISKMFDEFYGNTTTTPAETETTTTTTTSATTSTTTSTETTTTTTSSAATTAEETTTTATTTKAEDKTIGTNDEIAKMVEKDYFVKTGKKAASSELSENKDGSVTVELKDADGKMIDKYTIDPETGKGTDANGEAVELPQTGINSLGTAGAAVGAVMLMLAGAAAVYGSGVIRKKEND